jgi:ABC-2 type transport system ATP-binding protein
VYDVLRVVSLTDRADQAVSKYSGGMKRRVNIATGLVHQPRLLFLDEPTVGVDPQGRSHIFESVLRLNRDRRMSIIYTSHYTEQVELLRDRVAIIDQGEIIALDSIKNLIAMLGGGIIYVGVEQRPGVEAQTLGVIMTVLNEPRSSGSCPDCTTLDWPWPVWRASIWTRMPLRWEMTKEQSVQQTDD